MELKRPKRKRKFLLFGICLLLLIVITIFLYGFINAHYYNRRQDALQYSDTPIVKTIGGVPYAIPAKYLSILTSLRNKVVQSTNIGTLYPDFVGMTPENRDEIYGQPALRGRAINILIKDNRHESSVEQRLKIKRHVYQLNIEEQRNEHLIKYSNDISLEHTSPKEMYATDQLGDGMRYLFCGVKEEIDGLPNGTTPHCRSVYLVDHGKSWIEYGFPRPMIMNAELPLLEEWQQIETGVKKLVSSFREAGAAAVSQSTGTLND
ncbi:MAG: hypothetical protein V7727_14130 [Sneathiella sp.]